MPTKLKNLKIKRVALVDEGANPDAHIKFAKSKDGNEPMADAEMTGEETVGFFERLAAFVRKAFNGDDLSKAALTFAQAEEKRSYDKVMSDEIYPAIWAFMDSVCSILNDLEKTDDEKTSLLKQSVSEFSDAFSASAAAWAKAESANTGIVKDADLLSKMRDSITALIEKKADDEEDQPDDEDDASKSGENNDEDDDKDDEKPPVKKGAIDMEFDTSKMTPEEKAQFDDFAKRFGVADPAPAAAQPAANPAPAAEDDANVNKNLTLPPEVQTEIEALRKFRQDTEERELSEVAKRYTIIGKKPEELMPVLKSLKAAGGDVYDQFIAGLDEAVKAVNNSGMFSEVGKRGSASTSTDDAWGKIEAAAHEIIKSKPDMRWPDAVDAACNAHPELVEEYEKSRH